MDGVRVEVVNTFELTTHTYGPVDGRCLYRQHRFNFVEQVDGIAHLPIHFIDKAENRRIPQATDFHQFNGALFHTLGAINQHQGRIHRGESAVGILGKILVPGSIEQIDHAPLIGKLHHRRGHRDAPLLLHSHPVRGRVAIGFFAFDGARHLNQLAEQQQLFGDRGLTGIGVGDDSKGTSFIDFIG